MKKITAAGVVTFRRTPKGELELLMIHRPEYDDWSLPKGRIKANEYLPACAYRENLEETAVSSALGLPAYKLRYPVGSGIKTVHYWCGKLQKIHQFKPNKEIDTRVWVPIEKVKKKLSYRDEWKVVSAALQLEDTTPLLLVRHGKAMLRKDWDGIDQQRPLLPRGKRQAKALLTLLTAYGVRRIVSSPAKRCVDTLNPYAKQLGKELETFEILTEEMGADNPKEVAKLVKRIAKQTGKQAKPTAICGHRPVLGAMMTALGVVPWTMNPAETCIVHLNAAGKTVAIEAYKSLF